jgi:hypothetical protein
MQKKGKRNSKLQKLKELYDHSKKMLNKPMFEKTLFEIKSHSIQTCSNTMLNNF